MTDDDIRQPKNIGRRRLMQMLTAAGGLAAAGLVPRAWSTPAVDILESSAGAQPAPSPSATPPPTSPTPSVSVSVSASPPPPTPAPGVAGAGRDPVSGSPPFTG